MEQKRWGVYGLLRSPSQAVKKKTGKPYNPGSCGKIDKDLYIFVHFRVPKLKENLRRLLDGLGLRNAVVVRDEKTGGVVRF